MFGADRGRLRSRGATIDAACDAAPSVCAAVPDVGERWVAGGTGAAVPVSSLRWGNSFGYSESKGDDPGSHHRGVGLFVGNNPTHTPYNDRFSRFGHK